MWGQDGHCWTLTETTILYLNSEFCSGVRCYDGVPSFATGEEKGESLILPLVEFALHRCDPWCSAQVGPLARMRFPPCVPAGFQHLLILTPGPVSLDASWVTAAVCEPAASQLFLSVICHISFSLFMSASGPVKIEVEAYFDSKLGLERTCKTP